MRTPILLLLLLWSLPAHAQTTYPEAFAVVSSDACTAVGEAIQPNFGRGNRFPVTPFRLSSATTKDVDGMVKTVTEKITVPASTPESQLAAAWRAKLPALATKLAAKVKPYTAIGSLENTKVRTSDSTSQTPDSRVCEFPRGGVVMRMRYTRGRFTGDHNLYVDVLVGN